MPEEVVTRADERAHGSLHWSDEALVIAERTLQEKTAEYVADVEAYCRSTKTQVNPSSALNRTKHHQSNPSNVPGILDSNLSGRACIHSSKILGNLL